jgi:hypothetical protein
MDDLYEKDIMTLAHNFTTCICLNIYDKLSYTTDKQLKINFLIFFDFILQKLEIKNNTEEDVKNFKKILLRICNKNISNSEKYIDKIISNTNDFDIYEYKNLFLLFKDYFIKTLIIHFFQNLTKDNYKLDFYNYLKYLFYYVSNIYEVSDIFSFRKKLKKTKDTDEIYFKFINYDELKDIKYIKKHNENQEIIKKNKDNINLLFYNFIMYFCIYYYDIIFNKFNDHFDIFIKFINERLNITDKTSKDNKKKLYEDKSSEKIKTETIDKLIENNHDDLDNTEKKEIILHFKSFFISLLIKFNFKNYMNEYTKITDGIYTSFYTKLFEKIKDKIFVEKLDNLIFIEFDTVISTTNSTILPPAIDLVAPESSEILDDDLRLAEEAREKQEKDNEIALAKKLDEENARRISENYDMETKRNLEETAKAEALEKQKQEEQKRQKQEEQRREQEREQIERQQRERQREEQERQRRDQEEQEKIQRRKQEEQEKIQEREQEEQEKIQAEERQRKYQEEQERQIREREEQIEREREEQIEREREEQEERQRRQREEQEEIQRREQEKQRREQEKQERQRREQEIKDTKDKIKNLVIKDYCNEYIRRYNTKNITDKVTLYCSELYDKGLTTKSTFLYCKEENLKYMQGYKNQTIFIFDLLTNIIKYQKEAIHVFYEFQYYICELLLLAVKLIYCNKLYNDSDIINKSYEFINLYISNFNYDFDYKKLNLQFTVRLYVLYGILLSYNENNTFKLINFVDIPVYQDKQDIYITTVHDDSYNFSSNYEFIKEITKLYQKLYNLYM